VASRELNQELVEPGDVLRQWDNRLVQAGLERRKDMKQKTYVVLLVIVLLCSIGWTGYSQQKRDSKTTWEFTSVSSEKEANELGAQGWDLVTVSTGVRDGNGNGIAVFHLKRAR
jgi:hypothetical protein